MSTQNAGQGRFRRASATVLLGSAGGVLVALALTPVISRLFDPHVFGVFSTIVAFASIFVGLSTLRFEVFAQREASDENYWTGIVAALLCVVGTSAVVALGAAAAVAVFGADLWWLATGPIVAVASLQLVGAAVFTRLQLYRPLAVANFVQQAGTSIVQVIAASRSATLNALLFGFLGARLVWIIPLSRMRLAPLVGARVFWRSNRREGFQAGTSALINGLSGQLVILLVAVLHGPLVAGVIAMAVRVVVAPLGLVGQAVASAVVGEIGKLAREGRYGESRRLVLTGVRDNFAIAVLPLLTVAVSAPFIAGWVLGDQWHDAGTAVAALAAGALAQFMAAPFSQVLNLLGKSRELLKWDLVRLVLLALGIAVPAMVGWSWVASLILYSFMQVIVYLYLMKTVLRAISSAAQSDSIPTEGLSEN